MESAILRAQIDHVLNQITITALLGIAVVLLTGGVLLGNYPLAHVLGWCGAACGIFTVRLLTYRWLGRSLRAELRYRVFGRLLVLTTLLSSAVWGSAGLLFLQDPQSQTFVFVSLVIAGMVSGSLPSYSAYLPAYLGFVIPTFSVLMYQYHHIGMPAASLLAGMHMVGLIGISIGLRRVITNSITIDLKNGELLEQVTSARDEAERANRAKSLFMAAASHDLRQPLQAMGLLINTLSSRLGGDEATSKRVVRQLQQAHDALTELFNGILQLSRLESESVDVSLADFSLAEALRPLIDEFKPQAELKGLSFFVECEDCAIRSDPILLNRLLRNLLSNAIKFTERGYVMLSSRVEAGRLNLTVTDTGCGIAEQDQSRIFEAYCQIGNEARDRAEGIGLGLSVVQKLSGLLGHPLQLNSMPGFGSAFSLSIPLGDRLGVDVVRLPDELPVLVNGHRVLVIDDDTSVREAMQGMLEGWHCQVLAAASVPEALRLCARLPNPPDIIVSDYRLKDGVNGLEGMAVIAAQFGVAIPSLLISGDTDPELMQRARERQVFLLHKPVRPAQLRNVMRQLLGEHEAPRRSD